MTQNRARMVRTGENYTQAARMIEKARDDERSSSATPNGSTALKFSDADPEAEA